MLNDSRRCLDLDFVQGPSGLYSCWPAINTLQVKQRAQLAQTSFYLQKPAWAVLDFANAMT